MSPLKPSKRINIPKFQGVYSRESSKRRHLGKPDKCFDICYRDQKGKLIWEKVGWISEGYTAVAASQIRSERIRSVRHGEDLPKNKPEEATLGAVWTKYDEWLDTGKIDTTTDRSYYKNHVEPLFAKMIISEISVLELELLKAKLIKKGLAPATAKHILVLIRQLINKAILWGMWSGENPVRKVKLPKLNNSRERFLSYEEAHILFRELEKVSVQLRDMSLLSLHTGMRAGEIFAIKWSHLDMGNNLIHIADPKSGRARKAFMTPTIKDLFKKMQFGEPDDYVFPSRTEKRIVAVSRAFDRTLIRLGNTHDFWAEEFKDQISPERLRTVIENDYQNLPVNNEENTLKWLNKHLELPFFYDTIIRKRKKYKFSSDIKNLISKTAKYRQKNVKELNYTEKNNIQKLNRLLLETIYPNETPRIRSRFNNGVTDPRQKITFHTLRHTFASWLAMRGTPILTIKELLGHQSLAMTERYSHLSPDQKKDAVDDMEKLFRAAMTPNQELVKLNS